MERLSRFLHRRKTASSDNPEDDLNSLPPPPPIPQADPQSPSRQKSRHSLRQVPRRKTVSSSNSRPARPVRRESRQHVELPAPTQSTSTTAAARAAAAAAMSPVQQNIEPDEQKLFADFGPMSTTKDKLRRLSDSPLAQRRRQSDQTRQRRISAQAGPRTDWPLANVNGSPSHGGQATVSPRKEREHSLSRKPSIKNLRPTSSGSNSGLVPDALARTTSASPPTNGSKRSSIHKPLPKSPSDEFEDGLAADRGIKHDSGIEKELAAKREKGIQDADTPIDLKGVVDLSNPEDTTWHETWAPAVTHETITRNVHEIRQEVVTREIHTHDVYNRILPVVDFEVLPARHFVPVDGGYMEISADEVPSGAGASAQELIEQAIANLTLGSRSAPIIPDRFSARTFEGTEGDYREHTGVDGIQRTEQWWVHPPTMSLERCEGKHTRIQLGAPVSLGGVVTTSTASNVVGISSLLAEQRRQRLTKMDGVV